MRLTPAQVGVRLICGQATPRLRLDSLTERIRYGHDFLVKITRQDFGYDLQAWHDYLKESREGGYTYGRNIALPAIMRDALQSPTWQAAVASLTEPGAS
jgi:hypothetical protein